MSRALAHAAAHVHSPRAVARLTHVKRSTADEALRLAARGGENEVFFSMRALLGLGRHFEPDLVRIVMLRLREAKVPLLPSCRKLPDAAVPLLLEVLTAPERVFLEAFAQGPVRGEHVRDAGDRLSQLDLTLTTKQGRARLQALAKEARLVAAAQATVASAGLAAKALLPLLAVDASDASLDALLPLVHAATRGDRPGLDVLETQLRPFARGAVETEVLPLLTGSVDTRAVDTPLVALSRALELPTADFQFSASLESLERAVGLTQRAGLSVWLDARTRPHARVLVVLRKGANPTAWRSEDLVESGALTLPALTSLAELGAWKAAVAKTLKVRWGAPRFVKSSLRGQARERLVRWFS